MFEALCELRHRSPSRHTHPLSVERRERWLHLPSSPQPSSLGKVLPTGSLHSPGEEAPVGTQLSKVEPRPYVSLRSWGQERQYYNAQWCKVCSFQAASYCRDSTRWMLLSQVIELSVSHELFCLCSNTPTLRKASFNILAWPSLCFVGTEAALCPHLGKAGQR